MLAYVRHHSCRRVNGHVLDAHASKHNKRVGAGLLPRKYAFQPHRPLSSCLRYSFLPQFPWRYARITIAPDVLSSGLKQFTRMRNTA